MLLIAHETEADARASGEKLRRFGSAARRLMSECVEHQELRRQKISKAANLLQDAGFVIIRETGDIFSPVHTITPTLAGEEALEALELSEEEKT